MLKINKHLSFLLLMLAATGLFTTNVYSQSKLKNIPLPTAINSINEEFSGMAMYSGRVYLLPQYGSHKETRLRGDFNIYSLSIDSINRVIDKKDTALTAYQTIKVVNLDKLPDSIKNVYEGMESITIVNKQVYLSIEASGTYAYGFLLKGILDPVNKQICIDPVNFIALTRPVYIKNAGFESVTYLPKENKLLALYEFNSSPGGGTGYLIDTLFKNPPQQIKTPFLYFRITDIAAAKNGAIYGINYYWSGDYASYMDNIIVSKPEEQIKQSVPDLRDSLNKKPNYLKETVTTYARIVSLKSYTDTKWKEVATFNGFKNNWEGLVLFKKGALIVTDANRNPYQVTTFGYIEF